MIFLLGNSVQRVVQERIRNYLQKYLPIMQEVPPADWGALEGEPGTPKYIRNRQVFLASRLDVRQRRCQNRKRSLLRQLRPWRGTATLTNGPPQDQKPILAHRHTVYCMRQEFKYQLLSSSASIVFYPRKYYGRWCVHHKSVD